MRRRAGEAESSHPREEKLRYRADGFTPKKQAKFLKSLSKRGCVRDACRKVGISSTTAYRTRDRLPDFKARWDTAREMAASEMEILAWDGAMKGVDEVTIRNGEVWQVKRKPSDGVFRLMMQGANPRNTAGSAR